VQQEEVNGRPSMAKSHGDGSDDVTNSASTCSPSSDANGTYASIKTDSSTVLSIAETIRDDISEINLYLVILNIAKSANVRSLLLAASAFGCHSVLVVGQDKNLAAITTTISTRQEETIKSDGCVSTSSTQSITTETQQSEPVHNTPIHSLIEDGRLSLQRFAKWDQCVEYLQNENISLVGVEIDQASIVLDDDCFSKLIQRLDPKQDQDRQDPLPASKRRLDVAILMGNEGDGIHPKHMQACQAFVRIPQYGVGTASLNVNVAANIVLYRFHEWKRQWQLSQLPKCREESITAMSS
jgi:tRNA G18 (ribose-2'-O)-methylase SpoU